MSNARSLLGLLVGLVLLASAGMHALLGWPAMTAQLATTGASPDLVRGLSVGWYFGSAAMVAFGAIVLATFGRRLRGEPVSTFPALAIAVTYLAFGGWAYATSRDPFFFIFLGPGLLLLAASWGGARDAGDARAAAPAARAA